MPSLTHVSSSPVAEAAPNPGHVVVVPIFDTHSTAVRVLIDRLKLPSKHELDEKETRSSTIRLAHAATGRMKEVTIVAGNLKAGRIVENNKEVYPVAEIIDIIQSQVLDLPDISLEVSEELQSNNPRLCEAVLRSVFAPRGPGESLEDCVRSAQVVKQAFTLQPNVYAKAESRALKVAQYRRAELQLKLESLQKDEDALVPPAQFDDPVVYQSWKMEELQLLSNLVDLFGNLPSFSGGVQVKIISGEGLKQDATPKCSPPIFKKKVVESRVYCSVTILPARPGNMPSPGESEDGIVDRTPAFFSEVVSCIEDADWNSQSPWIPVSSMQDRILVDVWEKNDNAVKMEDSEPQPEAINDISPTKLANIRGIFKKQNTVRRKKIAPWNGDLFLGHVMISFSHIESQALAHGGVQGQSPATSYMLADERGRQGASTVSLQFTCSCERFYRDAPPNKLLLMPPVEDIETAFDNFVHLAFHAENEALFQLGPQWRQLAYTFGAHYRIRAERCALGIVNVMVGLFQEDARYCIGIVPEWLAVCSSVKDGRLTKSELALHCHICVSLMKPVVHALENFQTLFPGNKPKEAIPRLIELLSLILRWESDSANIYIPLRSFIQSSCERRLLRHLFKDTDDRAMKELTAQSVLKAVQLVRSDILEQSTVFMVAFPDGFNLPQITAPMYYKLVCHYVSTFMSESSPSTLTKEHAEILHEFTLLRGDVKELGIQVPDFNIESLFNNYLEQWIGSLAPRMIGWVGSSVDKETWEPLSTQPLVSSSVADLYVMIGQVVDEVALRLSSFSLKNEYIIKLVDAICQCIQDYVDTLEKLCYQELHKDIAKIHGNRPNNVSTFGCSRAVYIQMNNINEILGEQKKLKCYLLLKWQSTTFNKHKETSKGLHLQGDMDMIDKEFTKLEKSVQQVLSELIEATVERTLFQFKSCLPIVDITNEQGNLSVAKQQQSLVNDLDQHLTVMRESLHPELIHQFLRDLPGALLWCMEAIALNFDDDGIVTEVQCRDLGTLQDNLNKQFCGLQNTFPFFSKEGSSRFQKILACRAMDSQKLCDIYWQVWKNYQKINELPGNIIPSSRSNGQRGLSQTKSLNNGANGYNVEGTMTEIQLHVLDYLSALTCKSDRKSRELVVSHGSIAKTKYMQVELRLGKEKTLATYSCRLSRIIPGLFYITAKRVCFVKCPGVPNEKWSSSFLTFDKIQRIRLAGSDTLVFVPNHGQPIKVSRISNRDAAVAILNQQVAGSGTDLEKSMDLLSFQSYPGAAVNTNGCS
ncbi:hypothetical protein KC19_7G110800 [Ceratodon purpureus]|uniref:MHD1 domain-containing protein n=1 Tax=Ceratodon purpureus TaxID=3225 RepID=A0A8T0H793_CERPU|nr:hypothetical protein KC19_7G110800 [Ceratodon purpureus]